MMTYSNSDINILEQYYLKYCQHIAQLDASIIVLNDKVMKIYYILKMIIKNYKEDSEIFSELIGTNMEENYDELSVPSKRQK